MQKGTGLIHLYFGNGKGKTTAAMGLCARAAGYGHKVLIYQFMKDNKTSERKVFTQSENITWLDGLEKEKFSIHLTEKEKKERVEFYEEQFKRVIQKTENGYDMLLLDEILYAIQAKLFDENLVLGYLKSKPEALEVILTGGAPSQALLDLANYASEIRKIKHPYDTGQPARAGIEM